MSWHTRILASSLVRIAIAAAPIVLLSIVVQIVAPVLGLRDALGRLLVTAVISAGTILLYVAYVRRIERRPVHELAAAGAIGELARGLGLGALLFTATVAVLTLLGVCAIMLPDGDLAAVGDPGFACWLVEHGKPAPFGQGGETKLDPAVRHATRLCARGAARVFGFDPAPVLGEIEQALSPRTHLVATLTDVLVYPAGGHFARHKDTPSAVDLVGTLIVGLPIAHRGGAFRIEHATPHVLDWSGPVAPNVVRWVAMFSDVDHAVEPVLDGARVTLVYALALSDRARDDRGHAARLAALRNSVRDLALPAEGPLMIACTRHVIALDGPQPQGIETLRGVDRDLAEVLERAGFTVAVRTCVAARNVEDDPSTDRFSADGEVFYARLAQPLLERDVAALLECVVFDHAYGDGGGYADEDASTLAPWIAATVPAQNWLFRTTAAATFLRAIDVADDGFIGNGAISAHLYKLAALEVTR